MDQEFSASSEDPETFDVKDYFPSVDQGAILVTRLASLWRLGTDMKLESVDELQGESILKNSFGKCTDGERTSNGTLVQTSSDLWFTISIGSSRLIKLLQGLPLAINQAGSRETGTNVAQYMRLYDHAWRRLMTSRE